MESQWPKTVDEAVKICFLTLTPREKEGMKNTPEENLIMSHFGWAVNLRNEFGLWEGNEELIHSCGATNPDDASMAIIREVWMELNNNK